MRCDDHAEALVFTRFDYDNLDTSYEITIEDSYIGGDYTGLLGRFKRAWKAFTDKPVYYTGVFTDDKAKMLKFLTESINIINRTDNN